MYKFLLLLPIALWGLLPLHAEEKTPWQDNLFSIFHQQQTRVEPQPALTVQIPLRKLDTNDATQEVFRTTFCQAYALHENWLLAAGTCWEAMTAPNEAISLQMGNVSWPAHNNVFPQPVALPHLILIRVPNTEMTKLLSIRLAQSKKITLLAFKDRVQFQRGKLFLGTAPIKKSNLTIKDYQVMFPAVPAHAGHALILARDSNLYWFAVQQPQSTQDFVAFSPEDLQFVASTLKREDPQAYQRISLVTW